jgi:hypothetical protein
MNGMKLRLLAMGTILSALSILLMIARGFSDAFVGLLAVGVVLLVVGIVWKSK